MSDMEVLTIAVLGDRRSPSPSPWEARCYDGDFYKSEVTGAVAGGPRREREGVLSVARMRPDKSIRISPGRSGEAAFWLPSITTGRRE